MKSIGILYGFIVAILVILIIIVTSFFIRLYILKTGCYNQPSPYCFADPVCPQTNGKPIWMACEAQDVVNKCQNCPNGDCYEPGQGCPDGWCVNCELQENCSLSCTRFNNDVPACPSTSSPCTSNVPT